MLTMKAYKWILLFALWLLSVSSNGRELCNRTEVKAPLGSSVSLPCTISSNVSDWVKWSHKYEKDEAGVGLVDLSSNGRINFLDPRSGRVKIFPTQFSEMNYGIIIDELKDSDMGSYYCKQNNECFEVKLFEDEGEQFSEETCGKDFCETYEVPATLGSSVLLPCNFDTGAFKWVTWVHLEKGNVVRLSSEGRVDFQNPRSGRIKAFPNQALDGNYSTVIDELKSSDLGSYCCKQRSNCLRVELLGGKSKLSLVMLLIYSGGGVAALIIISLLIICYWLKCISNKGSAMPTVSETTQGATTTPSAPPQEAGGVNGQQIAGDDNGLVYENDDQYIASIRNSSVEPAVMQHPNGSQPNQSDIGIYPNLDEFKFERVESERTRQRFHIELFSRIRQASVNRHFYVNQGEIRKQQARAAQAENKTAGKGRRKAKDSCEYKNPIYNSSNDHLNHL